MYCKDYVAKELAKCLPDLELSQIEEGIEIPKEKTMGDYAFPCFRLAKTLRKAPNMIAQDVAAQLEGSEILEKVQAVGPYVNMFLNKTWRAQYILGQRGIQILDSEYTDQVRLGVLLPETEAKSVMAEITEGTNGQAVMEFLEECYFAVADGEMKIFEE